MLIGGNDEEWKNMDSVLRYNITSNEFDNLQEFPTAIRFVHSVYRDTSVFVFGGSYGGLHDAVFEFVINTKEWRRLEHVMPEKLQKLIVIPYN